MTQRIDELREPPVVGRFYLVPTVRYPYFREKLEDWPVLGPRHEDQKFFNFPYYHYHIDGRFLNARQRRFCNNIAMRPDWIQTIQAAPLNYKAWNEEPLSHPAPVMRRLRCSENSIPYFFGERDPVLKLRASFANERLVDGPCGWICPHRGAHLGSIKPDDNGVITCPLHGLMFRADTGEAVT